ncbi:hypothetical protein SGPA1_21063 [Streptomyces misionensis JCM 4497]
MPPRPPLTPRAGAGWTGTGRVGNGLDVVESVGADPAETITAWLPAVLPLEQTTTTV